MNKIAQFPPKFVGRMASFHTFMILSHICSNLLGYTVGLNGENLASHGGVRLEEGEHFDGSSR